MVIFDIKYSIFSLHQKSSQEQEQGSHTLMIFAGNWLAWRRRYSTSPVSPFGPIVLLP
ncbi:hypothetical protein DsansV1_C01g0012111 [Dioscorea sansibarensis]